MRLFIFPIGFHEDFAIRTLNKFSASKEDKIIAITLSPAVNATKNAFNSLSLNAQRIGISDINLIEIDSTDFSKVVMTIIKKFNELNIIPEQIIIDTSGGLRIFDLALFFSGFLLSLKGFKSTLIIQPESANYETTSLDLRDLLNILRLDASSIEIINQVDVNEGSTIEELSAKLNVADKTIRNKISELKKLNLIMQKGRGQGIYLTDLGLLVKELNKVQGIGEIDE
ncbi:CRISPR-associated CARF protein Csa3 [Caldisphaera sp.]|uniref:CRISPR-associated CARF protein Csa3 n=1 Tax=Caldisphaera sp. TaxID=2060322 RepID=UPI0025BFDED4|nr:CRISPR-associated CARF protein Csa3 [Caldisphaera sp.]